MARNLDAKCRQCRREGEKLFLKGEKCFNACILEKGKRKFPPGMHVKARRVKVTEYGRRLRENANHGTDHGHGNVMFVLGGNVNGGQVFGQWPGLANNQLYQSTDLAVTTDYRRVLAEIVTKRLGNPNLATVFPGYAGYTPLGILRGGSVVAPPPLGPYNIYLPLASNEACS